LCQAPSNTRSVIRSSRASHPYDKAYVNKRRLEATHEMVVMWAPLRHRVALTLCHVNQFVVVTETRGGSVIHNQSLVTMTTTNGPYSPFSPIAVS
jgi:hypothetical protein